MSIGAIGVVCGSVLLIGAAIYAGWRGLKDEPNPVEPPQYTYPGEDGHEHVSHEGGVIDIGTFQSGPKGGTPPRAEPGKKA